MQGWPRQEKLADRRPIARLHVRSRSFFSDGMLRHESRRWVAKAVDKPIKGQLFSMRCRRRRLTRSADEPGRHHFSAAP